MCIRDRRGDGGQIALYQAGNRVAAVSLPHRRLGQTAVQKRDCLEGLTSVLYQGRIYFAYCNLAHQVAVSYTHLDRCPKAEARCTQ